MCARWNFLNHKRIRFYLSFFVVLFLLIYSGCLQSGNGLIDREALVRKHFPQLSKADPLSPFSVGNGRFAFTADITGLQTFPDFYQKGIPLATQSEWGWHTIPDSGEYTLGNATEFWDVSGRRVPYASLQNTAAGQYLRANPHRLHLGRIGFQLLSSGGNEIGIDDIDAIDQAVDIWQGVIQSSFQIEGTPVEVVTSCHPAMAQVSARVRSKLLDTGQIGIQFTFPYGSIAWGKDPGEWDSPDRHRSEIIEQTGRSVLIHRILDADQYYVFIHWAGDTVFSRTAEHSFLLKVKNPNQFEFNVRFSETFPSKEMVSVAETMEASRTYWENFWNSGGVIDLSQSKDMRANELERRIVLSRYLTAIQCAGSLPPSETGLTCNSWYGKFHLEMHWWHGVHFALWGNREVLEKSLPWYQSIMPEARKTAEKQGYAGARWPKMVASDGRESPSSVGVFLIWQQPHPIYYAELLYRLTRDDSIKDGNWVVRYENLYPLP